MDIQFKLGDRKDAKVIRCGFSNSDRQRLDTQPVGLIRQIAAQSMLAAAICHEGSLMLMEAAPVHCHEVTSWPAANEHQKPL